MKKRFLFVPALLLIFCFLLPLLASCGGNDDESDPNAGKAALLDKSFTLTLDKRGFSVTHINGDPTGEEIVLYTRDYQPDGKPSVLVKAAEGRTVVCLRYEKVNGTDRYSIFECGDEAGKEYPIATNGFSVSIPTKHLSDLRIRVGQLVTLTSFDNQAGGLERLDLGTFYPSGDYLSALVRRIGLKDPEDGITTDTICLLTSSFAKKALPLPENSVVAVLEEKKSGRFRVLSVSEASETAIDQPQMIFAGAYNAAYAKAFLKEGTDLNTNDLDLVSSYSDSPAIVLDGKTYLIPEENRNAETIASDGIYLFDSDCDSLLSADASVERKDIVIVNDTVAYIGDANKRVMLPTAGGVVVTFAGEKAKLASAVSLGDQIKTVQMDTEQFDGKFVRIGKQNFPVDLVNRTRAPECVVAVYTPEFGKTTGTNPYGTEIAVENGKVITVEIGKGDMTIPEDGFVLSVHKDSEYAKAAGNVVIGESGASFLSGNNYGFLSLDVTGFDTVRGENSLIVYRKGIRTGTNVYGYEIRVDKNGIAIGGSSAGNSDIPSGGFVLSGHGDNKTALSEAFLYGATVLLDEEQKKVLVISSPDTGLISAAHQLDEAEKELNDAKEELRYLDYDALTPMLEELKKDIDEAKNTLYTDDCATALTVMDRVSAAMEQLRYAMIETRPVENRAVWYRSSEKSDDEVRATVEKMKTLGVNSIFLETWYNGQFIGYSENELLMHNAKANGDYDALEGFVRICHENGIEVHAWVENFFIGTVEAQEQANKALADHFEGRWLTDSKGKNTFYYSASNTNFIFMNPFDSEVRTLLLDFYKEIVTKYAVDGIHLDYIRFPELNYGTNDFGYNDDIVAAWQARQKTETDPRTLKSGELYQSWIAFRQEIITSFVGRVHKMLLDTRPDVWLSAAVYPGLPEIKNQIFQDCKAWVENGYMDELFSMSYGADNKYVRENARMFADLTGENCFYSTGISAFGDTEPFDFAKQLTEVVEAGADGVAIFSLGNITPSNYQHEITGGAFRSPSVQSTDLGPNISTMLRRYIEKAESLYTAYADLSEENLTTIKTTLLPYIYQGDAFVPSDNSLEDCIKYCRKTVEGLEQAKAMFSGFFPVDKFLVATADLDILTAILRTMQARLTERLPKEE